MTIAKTSSSSNSSIFHLLEVRTKKNPQDIAIVAPQRSSLTYSGLFDAVTDIVNKLNAIGVGRNDRVAVALPNGPEMAVAFLGIAAGATCAPLNPGYRESEYDFYLSDLDAKALIFQSGVAEAAVEVAKKRGIPLVELSPVKEAGAGVFQLRGGEGNNPTTSGIAQPSDVALVLHTSGTTSRPKMVPLTHSNLCTSAQNISLALNLTERDRCLNVMPLFHIHGLIGALLSSLSVITMTEELSRGSLLNFVGLFGSLLGRTKDELTKTILKKAFSSKNKIDFSAIDQISEVGNQENNLKVQKSVSPLATNKREYIMEGYQGKITLFIAPIVHLTHERIQRLLFPLLGWDKHLVDIIRVSGDHYSMVKEPDVKVLAESLKTSIDKALQNR